MKENKLLFFQGTQNIILEWRQGTNKYLYNAHNIARRQKEEKKKIRHCTNNKKYINKKAERLEAEKEKKTRWD